MIRSLLAPASYLSACTLSLVVLGGCAATKPVAPVGAPQTISDRGVQEHGKIWPRSIDSAYMGTWGDNRNSGTTLVTVALPFTTAS